MAEVSLWNCSQSQVIVLETHWWLVRNGSGNGLVPSGNQPLPQPMMIYCWLDPWEQTSVKFESKYKHPHSRKYIWKFAEWQSFCSEVNVLIDYHILFFQALGILEKIGLKRIMNYMSEKDDTLSTASANLLKNILNSITDIENIKVEREKYETARLADSSCKLRPFTFIADKIGESTFAFCWG